MNKLDKANTFLCMFCVNERTIEVKFTWFQFHRYVHGRHRCTAMDRRNELYRGSIGTHAHREVDAWFHGVHPQSSHWDSIRKRDIWILLDAEEIFFPLKKSKVVKTKLKRAFRSIGDNGTQAQALITVQVTC